MKPIDDIKLKKNLVEAYQTHPDVDINPAWQQAVMRRIREIGPLNHSISMGLSFQELVWKMAPAFCILLILLVTGIFSMDLSFVYDAFINDPVAVIYNGIFWG